MFPVLGAQKNRLIETVLLSTHNIIIMLWLKNKKINFYLHILINGMCNNPCLEF